MNDRYLYRAKRTDNREWVVGSYVYTFAPDKKCHVVGVMEENYWIVEENGNMVLVDKDTICQCTGLRDKNGKLIWENDIVNVSTNKGNTLCEVRYAGIVAHFQLWQFKTLPKTSTVLNLGNYEEEVIGNIFDNPELLEVEE